MILLIDNFDSFVANIARYFRRIGLETVVFRNDELDCARVHSIAPAGIVISPGPCTPQESGCSLEVIGEFAGRIPILGICLGHQAIGSAFGANIVRAPEPFHGRQSTIAHNGHFLFDQVPEKFDACRYHSLVIEESTLPKSLDVTCRSADGTIMAIADDQRELYGLQFHPESILTPFGFRILQNFSKSLGVDLPCSAALLFESESTAGDRSSRKTQPADDPLAGPPIRSAAHLRANGARP